MSESHDGSDSVHGLGPGPSDLRQLLGRPLAITIHDGRMFIGYFHCTDRDMNIILNDTEEFQPAPRTKAEVLQRDREEIWLPRSERLEGEPDWSFWANLENFGPAVTSGEEAKGVQGENSGSERGDTEQSLGSSNDVQEMVAALEDTRVDGQGSERRSKETETTSLALKDDSTISDIQQAVNLKTVSTTDAAHQPHESSNTPSSCFTHSSESDSSSNWMQTLQGWTWGFRRGPGRFTGMIMIRGKDIIKIELVHGSFHRIQSTIGLGSRPHSHMQNKRRRFWLALAQVMHYSPRGFSRRARLCTTDVCPLRLAMNGKTLSFQTQSSKLSHASSILTILGSLSNEAWSSGYKTRRLQRRIGTFCTLVLHHSPHLNELTKPSSESSAMSSSGICKVVNDIDVPHAAYVDSSVNHSSWNNTSCDQ
ncbi:hypothetical protein BD324DRAFT_127013 [Kockovaella imperatae]|uniref:Sm domain-containing protein n=1 Tax=Kockovaella imperatae TaxID=4999 RepID=A0A1Y1UAY9_9TREE|nr:hypothetical protein BD324DRAFT_127013 [Kockovaella imperatae]ORX34687.1 hypothetical protein BD324DRAFT_127013 [Kockovaella imperatae]